METAAIALLAAACAALLVWLISSERRRRAQAEQSESADLEATKQELRELLAKLEGRFDSILSERQTGQQALERQRQADREQLAVWKEQLGAIADSMKRLEDSAMGSVDDMTNTLKPIVSIFRSPQAAGIEFGEAELELLLRTHLGEGLYLRKPQHLAVGQDVVDFAVQLPDCLIPIDSKFPSASYRSWVEAPPEEAKAAWRTFRDELLRQMQATAKYIRPEAGTSDYALIFLPSDVIYQQAFLTQRILEQDNPIPRRAQELKVFGCSPQTLMPYMGLIRLGLRNFKIAEDVKAIRSQIEQLDVVFRLFGQDWEVLRGHLDRLVKHVERLSGGRGSYGRMQEAVRKLTEHDAPATTEPREPADVEPAGIGGHDA
ncbi:MAG TPA: DNA recombination protein RmuC [bacterium]